MPIQCSFANLDVQTNRKKQHKNKMKQKNINISAHFAKGKSSIYAGLNTVCLSYYLFLIVLILKIWSSF